MIAYYWQAGLVVIGTLIVAAAALFWWFWPKRQMRFIELENAKDRAEIEDNFRKTISQALGGIAVLIGAGFAYYQFVSQQRDSHDLLLSQQVSKGFEDLGEFSKVMTRVGAIYALAAAMDNDQKYHDSILAALCAFVRDSTKTYAGDSAPTIDVQTALTAIGNRKADMGGVNLPEIRAPRADLAHADLDAGYLHGADLHGADLRGAKLRDTELADSSLRGANLSGADFTDEISRRHHLTNTDLTDANLSDAIITQEELDEACGQNVTVSKPLRFTSKPCQAHSKVDDYPWSSMKSIGSLSDLPTDHP